MPPSTRQPKRRPAVNQHGAVVVEFALVFVLFFVVMYGIVCYGVIFAIKHSLEQAANEGARAAVADIGGLAARIDVAEKTAKKAIEWLGTLAPVPVVTTPACPSPYTASFTCVSVALTFDYAANPLVPPLPGLGIVLPATIGAQATVQLDALSAPPKP